MFSIRIEQDASAERRRTRRTATLLLRMAKFAGTVIDDLPADTKLAFEHPTVSGLLSMFRAWTRDARSAYDETRRWLERRLGHKPLAEDLLFCEPASA
jgi:hypothetical protein